MDTEENARRYWAFLSYSHADKVWADWLHKSLENYPMPRDLVGKPCPADAPIPKRFVPVFRDREELPTATDLGAVIARALRHARFLVVVCSPKSAKSPWVEKEIIEYKRLHGEDRVLCLIVGGEPWASDGKVGIPLDEECFPKAVRFRLGPDGNLSSERTEPIAADAREGKDGKENAIIKLMAGLLGVGFDDLRRREQAYQKQRVRRLQITSGVFALLFIAAVTAAGYAVSQKRAVQRTLSKADLQLAVQEREAGDFARCGACLARSLRSDPENSGAAMAAYSLLAHHKMHPPVGPVMRHPESVNAAFGSMDGKFIVTAAGKKVYLWSRPDHRLLGERVVDDSNVTALAPSPSGAGFVAGTSKGRLHFLALADLKSVRNPVDTASNGVRVLGWNPAGDVLAVGLSDVKTSQNDSGMLLRLTADGRELSRLKFGHLIPHSLAWSRDGKQVALAGPSPYFYVSMGDPANPELKELQSKFVVSGISFTEIGLLRVIDTLTGLSVWDTATGTISGRPKDLSPMPTELGFSPEGASFLGVRRSPSAYVYDALTGKIPTEPISPGFTVSAGIWLDNQHVLLASENGLAQERQIRPPALAGKLGNFRGTYPSISALSHDRATLAAVSVDDCVVRFVDTHSLKESSRPVRFPSKIHGMGFLADGKSLGALCWDGKFYQVEWRKALKFESSSEPLVAAVENSYSSMKSLRFNPQGTLAALPRDNGVMIIDCASKAVRNLIPVGEGVSAVAWSPDGSILATATGGQAIVFLRPDGNPASGHTTAKLNAPVHSLSWSPDGSRIVVLTNSDQVSFLNSTTGNPTAVSFQTGPACDFVIWVSDAWVLGTDMENITKLWDPESGLAVATLPKIGPSAMPPHALPDRGEVILSIDTGFALVPVPSMRVTPPWLPEFLEAMSGERLISEKNEPLIDPDAWLAPNAFPAVTAADPVWSPLRAWVLDGRADRPAAVGSDMTEPEAVKIRALADQAGEIDRMRKKMQDLWQGNDEAKMADAIQLLDEALKKDPDLTELHRIRLQLREVTKELELVRDSQLEIAAAADTTLIEALEAKTEAAKVLLRLVPPDPAAARKLIDEVLAENPAHTGAKEVLDKIPSEGK